MNTVGSSGMSHILPEGQQPLPRPLDSWSPSVIRAYSKVLAYRDRLAVTTGVSMKQNIVVAHVLGWLFHEISYTSGLENLASDVNATADDGALYAIGFTVYLHLCGLFKSDHSSPPSTRSSSDSSNKSQDSLENDTPEKHQRLEGICKKQALNRDDHTCVITGRRDWRSAIANHSLLDVSFDAIDVTRILPQTHSSSLAVIGEVPGPDKTGATLERYTGFPIAQFNAESVDRLENLVSLCRSAGEMFGRFYLWFQPIANLPDTYEIWQYGKQYFNIPNPVVLRSSNSDYPLPSGQYFQLHAFFARLARLSGSADHFEQLSKDIEDTGGLASDGSNATLLHNALATITAH